LADSINRSIGRYQITPSTTDSIFNSTITYDFKPKIQLEAGINSIISETRSMAGTSSFPRTTNAVDGLADNGIAIIYCSAAELANAGLVAVNIDGLRIYAWIRRCQTKRP
jgi:hypothetical protein